MFVSAQHEVLSRYLALHNQKELIHFFLVKAGLKEFVQNRLHQVQN